MDLFLACSTQFNLDILREPESLNYPAMYQVAESLDIKVDHVILRKIQVLEMDVISGEAPHVDPPLEKACRHPAACSICQKTCSDRMAPQE